MEILARYKDMLQSDILKVSHHGSITSTHEAMLKKIKPKYGIISYGNNNTYGFPNQIVRSRLKTYKVQTYETALEGTITFQYTKKRYKVIKNRN
jgi:competence protein ComEC